MAGLRDVLPCFKPAEWDGAERCVCRRFSVEDVESEHFPWLAFGFDQPHTFEFMGQDDLSALGKTADEVERQATENLRLRKATWEQTNVRLGVFKRLRFLACGDDYFAAEKILDAEFMREAGRRLKAEVLAVGIPRRGLLLATDGRQAQDVLGAFATAVSAQYHRGDAPPITPAVFAVLGGEVVGLLQGGEDLGRDGAEADDEEGERDYYVSGLVTADEATGLETVHICAGGARAETLGPAIESAFRQTLQRNLPRREFGGEIRVIIFNDMTPLPVREQMPSLEAHLRGTLEELGVLTQVGGPVTVTFEYQDGGA